MTRLGQFTSLERVFWSRVRDDISNAVLNVVNPDEACCQLLASAEPGRHEVVVFRGSERVWEGPITRIAYSRNGVEIEARDVVEYVYRTILKAGYDDRYPNCKFIEERAELLLRAELARKELLDPPINVVPHLVVYNREESRECRQVLRYEKTLWEELDSLAQYSGLDYTAVGRSIVVFDVHEVIGRTATVTERDFLDDVVVTSYGRELRTFGAATDGEGHFGWAGGVDDYYGLWESLDTVREEGESAAETPSRESLIAIAKNGLAGRNPTPTTVRVPDNSAVDPTGVLTIDQLVPGVRVPLRATLTCRTLVQEQKLNRVTVEETGAGERVNVSMSPAPGVTAIVGEGSDEGTEEEV